MVSSTIARRPRRGLPRPLQGPFMPPQYIFQIENLSKSIAKLRRPQEHLALVLPRRQDRRARRQRRGQEHAPEDHGGRRQGLRRDCQARARDHHRLCPARAAPRPDPRRSGERRAGRRQASRALLRRFDEINARMGANRSNPTRWRSCSTSRPRSQDAIDAANAWDLDRNVEDRHGRHARLPPGDARGLDPLGR